MRSPTALGCVAVMKIGDLDALSIKILLYVYGNPGCIRKDLRRDVHKTMETMYSRLEKLEREGLITTQVKGEFPVRKETYLTEKGKDAAKLLSQLHELLTNQDRRVSDPSRL